MSLMAGMVMVPRVLLVSYRKRLFDIPDGRKVHTRPVPRLGGVTFFPSILFTVCFLTALWTVAGMPPAGGSGTLAELLFFLAGQTLLYAIGIADDLVGVRYRTKFVVQAMAAAMFPLSGLYINDLYGIFGIHHVAAAAGIPLTMLLSVFITNAINLIDGIDGLASGLCMVASAVYGMVFLASGEPLFSLLAFACVGTAIPFFWYNVFGNASRGRKIFMGDTGSLTLGYMLGFFTVKYCMDGGVAGTGDVPRVLVAFGVLMVPCLDIVRVVFRRLRTGKNPFLPDKTHIHHKFLAMGFTAGRALVCIQLMSAGFCVFTIAAARYINGTLVLLADIVIWTVLNLWFDRRIRMKAGAK